VTSFENNHVIFEEWRGKGRKIYVGKLWRGKEAAAVMEQRGRGDTSFSPPPHGNTVPTEWFHITFPVKCLPSLRQLDFQ
jgi:hypothetical protein